MEKANTQETCTSCGNVQPAGRTICEVCAQPTLTANRNKIDRPDEFDAKGALIKPETAEERAKRVADEQDEAEVEAALEDEAEASEGDDEPEAEDKEKTRKEHKAREKAEREAAEAEAAEPEAQPEEGEAPAKEDSKATKEAE